jgi:pyruvate dehydrogenase E2 component (dihydrolipoamide acetyltransferase)/2-oxoisovalerate dehydrogenase E2 component (dihydrolipoyl transacylase)
MAAKDKKIEFRLPELGEGVYEAELVSWLVKAGDTVKRGQNLMEVLTDKATMEVPSPFVGTILDLSAEPGSKVKVGDVVLTYAGTGVTESQAVAAESDGSKKPAKKEAVVATADGPGASKGNGSAAPVRPAAAIKAAPSVRQLARKLGVDLAKIRGSGPQGRILIDDLSTSLATAVKPVAERKEVKPEYGTPGTRIKMQGVRRRIAEHMVQAKRTIPHYTYVDECDVTRLARLREELRQPFGQAGLKITYVPFFVKAAVLALKEVPLVNASLDEEAGEIVLHDHYHIGVAVATPGGLIVPVIRDADRKSLAEVTREVERLSADAREGRSRLEDLRGGTFTITSIGNIGGLFATPIINHPEVGILGVGKIVKRPFYDEAGAVKPADLVYLSFSFDHRVLDGAVGAVFGNSVLRHLEHPAALMLEELG